MVDPIERAVQIAILSFWARGRQRVVWARAREQENTAVRDLTELPRGGRVA